MLVSCMSVGCFDFVEPIQKSVRRSGVHEYFKKSSVLVKITLSLFFEFVCQSAFSTLTSNRP